MIAILKYNAGNIKSVQNALNRLGYDSVISDDFQVLKKAEKVIIPGVGEASSAMKYLRERKLDQLIASLKQPVLGVCLGLQLMCEYSEEGDVQCLGIFKGKVKKFENKEIVPHMGWNEISDLKSDIFNGVEENSDVYFVHSYYAEITDETIATCNYINRFSAAMSKDNFYATQFHPEKSSSIGNKILQNFLEL